MIQKTFKKFLSLKGLKGLSVLCNYKRVILSIENAYLRRGEGLLESVQVLAGERTGQNLQFLLRSHFMDGPLAGSEKTILLINIVPGVTFFYIRRNFTLKYHVTTAHLL